MTQDEAIKILAVLTAAYPNAYKSMTAEEANGVVAVWAVQFADVPADIVFMALNVAISSCKFPPSICEVKDCLKTLYWDAQSMLMQRSIPIDETTAAECQRICDYTSQYRTGKNVPELKGLLMNKAKQFLIE